MANPLMTWWERLKDKPGGKFLLSKALGRVIPYTGSVRARVLDLKSGYARVAMRDRRRVRNHLRSIHAVALMNLGEFSTGLAMTSKLSAKGRAIPTNLSIEFTKKARGLIVAECACPDFDETSSNKIELNSVLQDSAGDIVAKVTAVWLVGPA